MVFGLVMLVAVHYTMMSWVFTYKLLNKNMKVKTTKLVRSVQFRIALPALLSVGLFIAALALYFIPALEKSLMARKQEVTQRLVESAVSILVSHNAMVDDGVLGLDEAKQATMRQIGDLRYGDEGKDYFWISNFRPTLVMHPYRPDFVGQDLPEYVDATGMRLLVKMAEVAKTRGEGVVEYMWQWQDQPDRIVPKLSYVKLFKPWGWIVGTGIYVEDVRAEIDEIKTEIWLIIALVTVAALFLAAVVVFQARVAARERLHIWGEREKLIEELAGQREQFRSLVDNITTGVMQVDTELRIKAVNRQMYKWFEHIKLEDQPTCQGEFGLGCSGGSCETCPAMITLLTGEVWDQIREQKIHGELRNLRVVASPVLDANGVVTSAILMLDDITDRLRSEEVIRQAEVRYRGIFENSMLGIYQTTVDGQVLSVNPALAKLFGHNSSEELVKAIGNVNAHIYVDPERRKEFVDLLLSQGEVVDFESEARTTSNRSIWVVETARAVYDEAGNIIHIDGTMLDVTKRRQAELELEHQRAYFQELFDRSPLGIILVDNNGVILKANKGFGDLFGYKEDEVVGTRSRHLVVPDKCINEAESFLRTTSAGKSISKETLRKHADGTLLPVNVVSYPFRVMGSIAGSYYIYQDITERKDFEKQLSHQAFHDSLTNLPNRLLYMERLGRAVQRGRRRGGYNFAAMMIDLDRFKRVNDTMGHQAGDQLLRGVSLRILSCIRIVDTVARLGGDEFAILLEEFETPREVIQVANRIGDVLNKPFLVDGQEVYTSGSIGIVLDTREYERPEEILRDADIAMYQAKERGKDRLVFSKRMYTEVMEEGKMEVELRAALAKDQLTLYYQPIVQVESGELQGFEALVRWNHPLRGVVGPTEFIPLAEETGLIIPLGRWVIKEACEQMAAWCSTGAGKDMSMSINLSGRQFAQPDLVEYITKVLSSSGLDAKHLKLEITETVLMDDAQQAAVKLRRLKELGLKAMIDDFGTGYSSLSYLRQFPVDYLKIDRSFISGSGDKGENREIVNTIIMLARNLGLKVVAEGVEEPEQLEMLKEMKCDNAQGFMFSRPVNHHLATDILQEFLKVLRERKK